jgi:hypothetical protein
MAFTAYLSGGAANSDTSASIGGAKSSVVASGNLFAGISDAQFSSGATLYRCIYVSTDVPVDALKAWISSDTPSAATVMAIGWGAAAIGATETATANQTTAPADVSFSSPTSEGGGLSGGDFLADQWRAFWIRYIVNASTTPISSESFSIALIGEMAEAGLVPVITGGYEWDSPTYARLWGPGVSFIDYLSNINVGRIGGYDYAPSCRFRALHSSNITSIRPYLIAGAGGYGAGNGGTLRIRIFPDDGTANHRPDLNATPISSGSFTFDMSGGVLNSSERFAQRTLTPASAAVAGEIYHVFFDNTAADPVNNFLSVDCAASEQDSGRPNRWLSPWDWGIVYGTRGTPWTGSYDWTEWTNTPDDWYNVPVLQVNYANGSSQGHSNMESGNIDEAAGEYLFRVTSTVPVRERFTPPTTRTVYGFSVMTAKESGSGGLGWELKQGSTVLASGTIADPGNTYSKTAGDTGLFDWHDITFPSSISLTGSTVYDLVFTAVSTSVWPFAAQRNGGAFGFTYPAAFTQSEAEHWSGSAWLGAYHWDHAQDGVYSNWRVVLHLA